MKLILALLNKFLSNELARFGYLYLRSYYKRAVVFNEINVNLNFIQIETRLYVLVYHRCATSIIVYLCLVTYDGYIVFIPHLSF